MRWTLLLLAACSGAMPGPGAPDGDGDGDGWTPANGDCDDADPAVNPLAEDLPLDGVDQDCDGDDAVALGVASLDPGDLRITEFMPDPLAVEPAFGEWVELQNTTALPIDLEGLLLRDDGRDDAFVGSSFVVDPGAFVVIGGSTDAVANGGAAVDLAWEADMGLSNGEDAFVLQVGATVIDRVAWDLTWPVEDGRSVALDPDGDPTDPTSWCVGTVVYGPAGWGTPGEANAACPPPYTGATVADLAPGDLVINEVMQSPLAVEDDLGEWIEVVNRSGAEVDLQGLSIATSDGDEAVIGTALVVPDGAYVVFAAFADPAVNGGLAVDAAWGWDLGLRGSGMTLELRYGTVRLDAITYDNGLTFPDPEGASMSLAPGALDAAANDDGANWCEAVSTYGDGDRGTPGAPNDPC